MNPQKYFRRLPATIRPSRLTHKRALIVGAGSGGSRVTAELASLGVQLCLLDRPDEVLEEHNVLRHQLGYDSLGKSKVFGMADQVRKRNPSARVEPVELDVVADPNAFDDLVRRFRPHLILACTDNEQSKHVIEGMARSHGVPVVGAGVYDGGIGGEVYLTRPEGPCYGCIAAHLQLERQTPDSAPNVDYNALDLDEIRSTCALNIDIGQIVIIQVRLALNLLLGGVPDLVGVPPEVNLFVFANRTTPGVFARPLHCEFYAISRQPDCLVCGTKPAVTDREIEGILDSLARPEGAAAGRSG